jgi:hypothetical protein
MNWGKKSGVAVDLGQAVAQGVVITVKNSEFGGLDGLATFPWSSDQWGRMKPIFELSFIST